ncbi:MULTISPECIES: autotransporter [unclassified Variovorax]|uniref:autotransporter n=1 Tax=unclassified Variovorax TaxID=663243 RepID=UPI001BD6C5B5|nr:MULTISPECIES: autotransporter [unclassified Variovorax]
MNKKSGRIALAILSGLAGATHVLPVGAQSAAPPGNYASDRAAGKVASAEAIGREAGWPRTIKTAGNVTLIVFEPQLDSWDGANLVGRSAVQVEIGTDRPETRYGIVSFNARTLTDKGTRVVTVDSVQFAKVDFPSSTAAQTKAWSDAIAKDLTGRSRTIALDRLEAALSITEEQRPQQRQPLRNQPPRIVFSSVPAILVSVDGEPRYGAMQGTPFQRVLNTRPLVLRDSTGTHYLKVFDGWMSAPALAGPWQVLNAPAASLARAFKQASDAHAIDPLTGQSTADRPAPSLSGLVPSIVVAQSPTELIVTDGPARPVPLAGTQLLYVENTTGNIFKDMLDNRTYVLVAGRWFRAASEAGPWEYVAANALPPEFAQIPDDSPKENVKASIAGTSQAREAVIAASVPQTAAVKVSGTALKRPIFDGAPVFKPIEGTALSYVANSPTAIIRVSDNAFYAVENGVWFTSGSVTGPWSVARSVPAAIYAIPSSSPLHYVTFVRIYEATPDVVYTGYSPGYMGSYVDPVSGVVVYGTGYYYDPWIGSYWYGAPVTYGYGAAVAYTPWTGWAVAFGLGWAWGAATVATGWGWGPYPYWGPWAAPVWGGAAFGPRGGAVAWGPGGWAGYSGNIYSQWGSRASVSRVGGGYNAWTGNAWAGQVGSSYNSRTGIASAGQRGAVGNVYAGNYAAGARGVAAGPGGAVAVGGRGTAGNAYTGNEVSGGRGAVYNPNTGNVTGYARATGEGGGTVARVGNDVYAGKDGNVYRNTGDGWQQHTQGGGWSSASGPAMREGGAGAAGAAGFAGAGGGAGGTAAGGAGANSARIEQLNRDLNARDFGGQRAQNLRQSSMGMDHSWGGGGGQFRGGGGGGFHGGGGFRGGRR